MDSMKKAATPKQAVQANFIRPFAVSAVAARLIKAHGRDADEAKQGREIRFVRIRPARPIRVSDIFAIDEDWNSAKAGTPVK